jgi:hypothetical protein
MANNGGTKLFGDGADNVNLFLPQGGTIATVRIDSDIGTIVL